VEQTSRWTNDNVQVSNLFYRSVCPLTYLPIYLKRSARVSPARKKGYRRGRGIVVPCSSNASHTLSLILPHHYIAKWDHERTRSLLWQICHRSSAVSYETVWSTLREYFCQMETLRLALPRSIGTIVRVHNQFLARASWYSWHGCGEPRQNNVTINNFAARVPIRCTSRIPRPSLIPDFPSVAPSLSWTGERRIGPRQYARDGFQFFKSIRLIG